MTRALLRTRPLLLFLLTLAAVLTIFAFLVRSSAYTAHPGPLSLALTLDLLLTIPLAYLLRGLGADDPGRLEAALRPPAEER